MAVLGRDAIIARARIRALDADSSNLAVSASDAQALVNHFLQIYSAYFPEEFVAVVGAAPLSLTIGNSSVNFNETVRQVRGLIRLNRTSSTGPLLEKRDVNEVIRLINEDSTQGTPNKWGYVRGPSDNGTQTYTIYVHPIADGTYSLTPWCEYEHSDFADGNDEPTLGVLASVNIADLVADEIARLTGRSKEFRDGILAGWNERLAAQKRTTDISLRPRNEEGKSLT